VAADLMNALVAIVYGHQGVNQSGTTQIAREPHAQAEDLVTHEVQPNSFGLSPIEKIAA